jgi:hypothetical protein
MNPAAASATEFLSSEEVIDILVNDPLLRRAAITCVLPATRVGDVWMFRRADLQLWIERQKREAAGFEDPRGEAPRH